MEISKKPIKRNYFTYTHSENLPQLFIESENSFWKGRYYKIRLYFKDQLIDSFSKKDLKQPREVKLSDGNTVYILFKRGLNVIKDGYYLPGSVMDPESQIIAVGNYIYFLGALSILGSFNYLSTSTYVHIDNAELGFISSIISVALLFASGFATNKRKIWGPILCLFVYLIDTMIMLFFYDFFMVLFVLLFRIFLLYPVLRGIYIVLSYIPGQLRAVKK